MSPVGYAHLRARVIARLEHLVTFRRYRDIWYFKGEVSAIVAEEERHIIGERKMTPDQRDDLRREAFWAVRPSAQIIDA